MIKVGDVVTLNSDSKVKMNVQAIYGDKAEVVWMNESNEIQTKQINLKLLTVFNESIDQSKNEGLLLG